VLTVVLGSDVGLKRLRERNAGPGEQLDEPRAAHLFAFSHNDGVIYDERIGPRRLEDHGGPREPQDNQQRRLKLRPADADHLNRCGPDQPPAQHQLESAQ